MQCLTHVMKLLAVVVLLFMAVPTQAKAAAVMADLSYCESVALLAKAGSEAQGRKTPIQEWRKHLQSLRGYVVKNKDNVLYSVLPKAIQDVDKVYAARQRPMATYTTAFNSCMANDYGNAVAVATLAGN